MFAKLKELLIGPALPTQTLGQKQLDKIRALAAFSPDALASIAYANQEIYLGLIVAGSMGLSYAWPIGLGITALLVMVALSYYQTIHGYPSGGGSYVVARSNLGTLPGLLAAAALLVDYLLNAAVSLTAGVAALASAFPELHQHRVAIALGLLMLITLINLRGMQEAGTFMAVPVYFFLAVYLSMLVYGIIRLIIEGPTQLATVAPAAGGANHTFPDPAYFFHRQHGSDGDRSHQQRCAGLQGASIKKCRADLDGHGRVDGHPLCGQHRVDAIPGCYRRSAGDDPVCSGKKTV